MRTRILFVLPLFLLVICRPSASAQAHNAEVKHFTIVAQETPWTITPDVSFTAWTYNGSIPGPIIDVVAGDTIVLHLINHLSVPVSVHPHGVTYDAQNDGSYGSGAYAPPGGEFTYTWKTSDRQVGTWLYHDHVAGGDPTMLGGNSVFGIARGLFGMIVVRPRMEMMRPDREYFLFMGEFMEQLTGVKPPPGLEMLAGFNGKSFPSNPTLYANQGERVRFHIASVGTEQHTFHLHGHRWVDPGTGLLIDAKGVAPFETTTFDIVAGQNGPGEWLYHCHDLMHLMEGMEGKFVVAPR